MLLTLMMNLNMFGGAPSGGQADDGNMLFEEMRQGGLYSTAREEAALGRKRILEQEEEDVFYHAVMFVICQE